MKAIVATQYGPPEVLKLKEIDKPVPKPGQVLVRVRTTSVTAADYRARAFEIPSRLLWFPARLALGLLRPRNPILGIDFAGEVEAVGEKVIQYAEGNRVFGSNAAFGSYAEYVCLPENGPLVPTPDMVSDEEVVSFPFGMLTAFYFLRDLANVRPGQKVLIYGASGAVGVASVQYAKCRGAEVTGVCSAANVELVKALGADSVLDYTTEDFTKAGETWDVIFDTVGKTSFLRSKGVLSSNGCYLTTIFGGWEIIQMIWTSIFGSQRMKCGVAGNTQKDLFHLRTFLEEGRFEAVIDRSYPLTQIVEAHRYADQGHKKGNIVITM